MFEFESPLGNPFKAVPTQRSGLPGVRLLALLGTLIAASFLVWVLPVYAQDTSGDGNAVMDEAPLWSADMLVVEYTSVSIGAASADLFSNVGGTGGLQIKSLWSHTPDRDLRLAFQEGVSDAENYTLQVGDLALEFPAGSSGQSSFKWTDVDVDWEDGQTISVRIVQTSALVEPTPNTPATGSPTISVTAQVGETLAVDISGIADEDGLNNVSYRYQWIANDGTVDTDIQDATASTYTPSVSDVGKSIKVKVSFSDDANNDESLTSVATAAVAATVPTAPLGLTVSRGSQIQELDASWQSPSSTGGSDVTGYKVQWKETADSWDTATDVSEATVTGTTHTITGLTGGVEYTVRVIATNDVGDGPASTEAAGTPAGSVSEQNTETENNAPTGLPTITGTLQVDETLTVNTSGISDADGLTNVSYNYQWVAGGSDIVGADGSSYTLTSSEQGQTITVRVTFTDAADNSETLTSIPTAEVAARTIPPSTSAPAFATSTTSRSIAENSEAGTAVGRPVVATDADDDTITYTLSGPDMTAFGIDGSGQIRVGEETVLDYESRETYTVEIVATDSSGETATIVVTIMVTDVIDPNIVLIMADDVGYEVFGANGSTQYLTPKLDDLAGGGVRFTNAHSKPCCSPSRVALMTGKSNVRNYVDFGVLPRDEYLMIDLFREAGYATAIAGKWRQNRVVAIVEGVAGGAGFDTYCLWGTRNAGDNRYWNASPECDGQVTELETDEYAPDVFVNFLLEFIESNQDRPFFAYYPMVLSHPPFVAPPQSQCPGDDEQCIFEDMVAYMDGNVGRLHSKLAELELLDNTIVLFTSDNGTPHMMVSALNGETIHGDKATTRDVSTHVPLFVHVPGEAAGRVVDDLIDFTDFLPTLADAAGLTVPNPAELDGVSFWDRLQGMPGNPRKWLYTYYFRRPYASTFDSPIYHPEVAFARDKRYKLYDTGELFDVSIDPHELYPLPGDDEESSDARTKLQAALDSMPDKGQAILWSSVNGTTIDGRPRWRPVLSGATVTGDELTLTYAGYLDETVRPPVEAFTAKVDGIEWTVSAASINRTTVTLTLASPVIAGQTVTVSYSPGKKAIRHVNRHIGHKAVALTDVAVKNVTVPNHPATGAPTISVTAQVGQELTSDVSGIADADGLTNVSYRYQWVVNDGTTDANILNAAASTYTPSASDVGKTIKVRVSFTDDADNEETLTSAATDTVAATKPGAPGHVNVFPHDTGALDVYWEAPTSNGGSVVTGYKVQWKETADSWDTATDVSEATVTGTTHTITGLTGGVEYTVRVIATNDVGDGPASTEAADTPAGGVSEQNTENSAPTGLPTISGTPQVGETLSAGTSGIADEDGLNNVSYNYQWIRSDGNDDADIDGETASTYTLTDTDEGKTMKVKVSFTDDADNQETLTSAATVAVAPRSDNTVADEAAPVWSADMLVVEYSSVSIGAASADLFTSVGGSAGLQIKSLWSYTLGRDLRLAFQEGVSDAENYTLQVGDLALEFPAGSSGQSSFKWTDVDVDWEDGQTISVRIVSSATETPDDTPEPAANTAATGQPTINGTPQAGEKLTANISSITDADGLTDPTYEYQWLADDTDISGATNAAYTLTDSDVGKVIKVKVSFTDDADNTESLTSEATAAVTARPNISATGAPDISGTATVREALTADTSRITDEDGLTSVSYSYQWLADDVNIEGATGATYLLADGDAGKVIKVRVYFDDDRDNAESLTSEATGTIAATVPTQPLSLTVTIGDQVQELDASWQAPSSNGGSEFTGYKVQWKESADNWDTNADVTEAEMTGTTYTITGLTGAVEYAVRVIATNAEGNGPASAEAKGTPAGGTSPQLNSGDSTSPTVSSIAITSDTGDEESTWDDDGIYGIGDIISVTVTFSEDVTVKGSPRLELDIGGTAKKAEYKSAEGSKVVFGYTVAEGYSDSDGIAISENKLTLNGGSIKDAADNAADLSHDALTAQEEHQVDGVRPTISLISLGGSRGGIYRANIIGEQIHLSVKFSEEIVVDGSPQIALDLDSGTRLAYLNFIILPCPQLDTGDSTILLRIIPETEEPPASGEYCLSSDTRGIKMVFSYTVARGDLDPDGLGIAANAVSLNGATIRDTAGNDAVLTHDAVAESAANLVDGVPPEVTSFEIISDPGEDDTYAAGDIIKVNVTYSEEFEVLWQYPRLRLDIGGKTRMAYRVRRNVLDIQSGEVGYIMAYSYTVQDGDNDDDGISIPANALHRLWGELHDANGNEVDLSHEAVASNAGHKVATATVESADNSPKTGLLTITGTLRVGETVTADLSNLTDDDGLEYATFSAHYDWGREGGGLYFEAMRNPSYVIAADDEGKKLQVEIQFFDDNGNLEYRTGEWSDPVGPRAPSNSASTGLPTITGTPQVDQTLTANTSSIDDEDGLDSVSYSYQWIRSDNGADTDIAGETDSTYTLVLSDQGKTIKVKVTFTDDDDNDEILTSVATAAVAAKPNTLATGLPTISGTPQVGETLTADTANISDEDGLDDVSYSYEWISGGSDIDGATGSAYTLTSSEQGETIQVRITFTDDADNEESLTSEATEEVAAAPVPLTVSLTTVPSTHDGTNPFTFDISFSEHFGLSYITLKSHAFTVTEGSVEKAQRTDKPSNIPWKITVQPDGNGDVTIVLPATTDCGAQGAICTGDDRKLSNRLEFTVRGP